MKFKTWVLEALARNGKMRAIEIQDAAVDDGIDVSLGSIYAVMGEHLVDGLVDEECESGGIERGYRRKLYWKLTEGGHRACLEASSGLRILANAALQGLRSRKVQSQGVR